MYRTVLAIPQEAKEQDIRKALRKNTLASDSTSALLSSSEIAQWDGTVPEYSHLDTLSNSDFLIFQPLGIGLFHHLTVLEHVYFSHIKYMYFVCR